MNKTNQEKLKGIIEKAINAKDIKGSQNQILGDYYTSFTNMENRNLKALSPIQAELEKIKNIKSKQEIVNYIAESHKYGLGILFSYGVDQDLKSVNRNIVYIGQSGIGLPNCEYYLKADKVEILKKYESHISATFKALKYDDKTANKMAKEALDFEKNLASSMMTPAEQRLPENIYNLKSKAETDKLFGNFDFESFLVNIGSQSFDSVVMQQPKFIQKVAAIFEF